jgi:hypothetical protein
MNPHKPSKISLVQVRPLTDQPGLTDWKLEIFPVRQIRCQAVLPTDGLPL